MPPPPGRLAGTAKVGEKGQIVIPKDIRDLFGIGPGDTLLLLADVNRGIVIVRNDHFSAFIDSVLEAQGRPTEPGD